MHSQVIHLQAHSREGMLRRPIISDVLAMHQQNQQPLLHKVMGKRQQSRTQESPFQETFIEWFQALGKKEMAIYY